MGRTCRSLCVAAAGEKDAALRRQAAPFPAWDHPVFVLNCLTYFVDTLAPCPCAARKHAEMDSAVEAHLLEPIEEHVWSRSLSPCFPYSPRLPTFLSCDLVTCRTVQCLQYNTGSHDSDSESCLWLTLALL